MANWSARVKVGHCERWAPVADAPGSQQNSKSISNRVVLGRAGERQRPEARRFNHRTYPQNVQVEASCIIAVRVCSNVDRSPTSCFRNFSILGINSMALSICGLDPRI